MSATEDKKRSEEGAECAALKEAAEAKRRARIRSLHGEGYSNTEIAAAIGKSRFYVEDRLREMGLTRAKPEPKAKTLTQAIADVRRGA